MKTKLTDLNDHLFETIESLKEDGLSTEDLDKEIKRAYAVNVIAKTIIENANLQIEAIKLIKDGDAMPESFNGLLELKR
jgi:hypothetical protein